VQRVLGWLPPVDWVWQVPCGLRHVRTACRYPPLRWQAVHGMLLNDNNNVTACPPMVSIPFHGLCYLFVVPAAAAWCGAGGRVLSAVQFDAHWLNI
jgi:hypothetical protein